MIFLLLCSAFRAEFGALGLGTAAGTDRSDWGLLYLCSTFRAELGAVGLRTALCAVRRGRLDHLRATFRAEFGPRVKLRSATRAFVLGMKRLAALGTELGALSASAAAGAESGGFRSEVKILGQILAAHFFLADIFIQLFRP